MGSSRDWPGDEQRVAEWVRAMLRAPFDVEPEVLTVDGLDHAIVRTRVLERDLSDLLIDLTGVRITTGAKAFGFDTGAPADGDAAAPQPIGREAGMLRVGRALARPILVNDVKVNFEARVTALPIAWESYTRPLDERVEASRHAIVPNDAHGLQGFEAEFEAAMVTSDIERLFVSLAQPLVESAGAKLTGVSVELSQGNDHVVHLTAAARVRWKWLSGSARVRAAVRVAPDGRCTLLKLRLRSRNPLLALALLAARGQVKQAVGREIDLNQALAEQGLPLRVSHVAIAVRREALCRVKLEGLARSG